MKVKLYSISLPIYTLKECWMGEFSKLIFFYFYNTILNQLAKNKYSHLVDQSNGQGAARGDRSGREDPDPIILVCYPAAINQSIIRDDIEIEIQLMKAKATEIWYFWHSSPKWQCPISWKYKTVSPAEAEAAARDIVAVTQSPTTKRLINTGLSRTFFFSKAYASNKASTKLQMICKAIDAIKKQNEV